MCLHTTDFVLSWDKGTRDYVGYGYKNLKEDVAKQYKRKWVKAEGNLVPGLTLSSKILPSKGEMYHPGFHIFLNKSDAEQYHYGKKGQVVRVKFRGVLAFGTNEVCYINPRSYSLRYGPCVIAQYMKLAEENNGNTTTTS